MPSKNQGVPPVWDLDYYSSERLGQYYFQIQAVRRAQVKEVLEIGPGPGAVTHILRTAGIRVVTCDLDKNRQPDVCADIRSLPLPDQSMAFTLCCQVLEHLPFQDFPLALAELKRVTAGNILISIPYAARVIYSLHKLPGGRRDSWVLHFPWLPAKHTMSKQHFWEMGQKGYSKKIILHAIQQAGLTLLEDFTPVEAPNNQFFLLHG